MMSLFRDCIDASKLADFETVIEQIKRVKEANRGKILHQVIKSPMTWELNFNYLGESLFNVAL